VQEGSELDRVLVQIEKTFGSREHAARRLRVAITHLEDAGKLEACKAWLLRDLRQLEHAQHDVTDALDQLAGRIQRLTGSSTQ
jgi:hypothetical protein